MIANRGFDVVVFGHTHRAERVDLPHGATYLNSGNWLRDTTFVQIADNKASLFEMAGSAPVPSSSRSDGERVLRVGGPVARDGPGSGR